MDCPVGTVRSRIFRAREAIDSSTAYPGVDDSGILEKVLGMQKKLSALMDGETRWIVSCSKRLRTTPEMQKIYGRIIT